MKLSSLKVDSKRAQQGAWVKDIPQMGDLRLRVRGFSNTDYQAFMAKEGAKITREQREGGRRDGALLPAVRDDMMIRGMVEHILCEWGGLTDEAGEPVPYTKEQALAFLSNPDFRPFREAVGYAASEVEEIETDKVEAVVGNSLTASGGKSDGGRTPEPSSA